MAGSGAIGLSYLCTYIYAENIWKSFGLLDESERKYHDIRILCSNKLGGDSFWWYALLGIRTTLYSQNISLRMAAKMINTSSPVYIIDYYFSS